VNDAPGGTPTYHDLYITAPGIPRTSIFSLGYGLRVTCTRVGGWQVWHMTEGVAGGTLIGGEYGGPGHWLTLDVAGHIITDSRPAPEDTGPTATALAAKAFLERFSRPTYQRILENRASLAGWAGARKAGLWDTRQSDAVATAALNGVLGLLRKWAAEVPGRKPEETPVTDQYPDRLAVANKVEWEGGLIDALGYGIHAKDMPEGDTGLTAAWTALENAWNAMQPLITAVEALLPEPGPGDGDE
jgi:hypothetical protein